MGDLKLFELPIFTFASSKLLIICS